MKERKRNRLDGYDYSSDNLYFVTSNVKDNVCSFGKIKPVRTGRDLSNDNEGNKVAPEDNVGTGHDLSVQTSSVQNSYLYGPVGIMLLNKWGQIAYDQWYRLLQKYTYVILHDFVVMPNHIHGIIQIDSTGVDQTKLKIKTLSGLIGAYKTTTSKLIHNTGYKSFSWHRSFHDHIIRNEESWFNISFYIQNNPSTWMKDKFYKQQS